MTQSDDVLDFTRRNYKPVNKCIYCGKEPPEVQLTREHIVPFSLGGKTVLPKSSCLSCAEITKAFETTVARKNFGRLRIAHGYQTNHPQERPTTLVATVSSIEGIERKIDIPSAQYPEITVGWSWDAPGLILGREPTEEFPGRRAFLIGPALPDSKTRLERLGVWSGATISLPFDVDFLAFARMLAKIGHAFAVAEFGLSSFTPLLPNLILGTDRCLSHLIGESPWPIGGEIKGDPFWLQYGTWTSKSGETYLGIQIQLFRHLNFPVFMVVVGKPSSDLTRLLSDRGNLKLQPHKRGKIPAGDK